MGEIDSADCCSAPVLWGQRYGQRVHLAGINSSRSRRQQWGSIQAIRTSPRSRNLSPSSPNPPVEQQACESLEAAETVARRQTDWRRADNCEDERRAGAGVRLDGTETRSALKWWAHRRGDVSGRITAHHGVSGVAWLRTNRYRASKKEKFVGAERDGRRSACRTRSPHKHQIIFFLKFTGALKW